jgi:amino acid transporter
MATTEPVSTEFESEDRHLRKTLSFQDLFFLSMGGIIGSGWLLAALGASSFAGPAVVLSWIIGGILVLFIALTYAEVAGMLPRSGAIVRYPHLTHGSYTGFFLAWAYLLAAASVPTIEAEAVVTYASKYINGLAYASTVNGSSVTVLTGLGILFGALLTIVFFLLNYFGIKLMGKFNTVITWWKFVLPVLTFIFLFFLFNGSNFSAYGGFTPLGIAPIFKAIPLAGIVFSYLGFRQALDFGGEARNPQRDVPRATIFSVIAGMTLYTLLQIAFTGAIKWSSIGEKLAIGLVWRHPNGPLHLLPAPSILLESPFLPLSPSSFLRMPTSLLAELAWYMPAHRHARSMVWQWMAICRKCSGASA